MIRGSGTIHPQDGSVVFRPDDVVVPINVVYFGGGLSSGGGTTTTTYSICSPSTPSPNTHDSIAAWLLIPPGEMSTPFTTTPDLKSFSDQWVDVRGSQKTTWEWSFVKVN
jgi:hypothetical protein